jgi:hypothetical protein
MGTDPDDELDDNDNLASCEMFDVEELIKDMVLRT